ncbi:MAG: hypothetical protein AB1643_01085 [Patescibacteria group bacterium]
MKGFTIIEILIFLAIMVIVISIVFVSFTSLRKTQSLDNAVDNIVALINEARSRTLASKDFSQYGVHFESSRAVLFKGTMFSEPSSDNSEFALPAILEISGIALNGGGSDTVFQRITGKTDNFGTITLRIKSDTGTIKNINIRLTGMIDAN